MEKLTRYTILATEFGQAIECGRCHLISYHPADVENRYCGFCKLFLNTVDGPFPPLTMAEFQTIYMRLYRFLTAEQAMRELVFPAGHAKRHDKLTAVSQAIQDLLLVKDILKQLFLVEIRDPTDPHQAPMQPPLLDVPATKPKYQ